MTHGDDDGLAMPPRVTPTHAVLLPIIHKPEDRQGVMEYCDALARQLRETEYHGRRLVVEIDDRDIGGARGWEWIKKGVPLRVEIGPRDIAKDSLFVARRDFGHRDRFAIGRAEFVDRVGTILDEIQQTMYQRALTHQGTHTHTIDDNKAFYEFFTPRNSAKPEIHGGFAWSHWCGNPSCEATIKEDLMVTIRCLPFDAEEEEGRCICCGAPSLKRAVFAKAY
jgi:prolyl-tRNA synthetase